MTLITIRERTPAGPNGEWQGVRAGGRHKCRPYGPAARFAAAFRVGKLIAYRKAHTSMLITVRVLPRSSKNTLEWEQGNLKARLTAPPVDGAANEALIALLAERLDVPRRSISIVRGASSRHKTVEIAGLSLEDIQQKID